MLNELIVYQIEFNFISVIIVKIKLIFYSKNGKQMKLIYNENVTRYISKKYRNFAREENHLKRMLCWFNKCRVIHK